MPKRMGNRTILFETPPYILSYGAVGGKKEGEGPLGKDFDRIFPETAIENFAWAFPCFRCRATENRKEPKRLLPPVPTRLVGIHTRRFSQYD